MFSRRTIIKSGALALFATTLGEIPGFIAKAALTEKIVPPYKKKKVLVTIFQRGGMDGLMAVSPFTDEYFKEGRPLLFMPAAKSAGTPIYDLDGRFGLHPSMSAFNCLFQEKQLAIIHGVGSANKTRSHFETQDYIESGSVADKFYSSGWLNRAAGLLPHEEATTFRAVSVTSALPRSFYGDNNTLVVNNLPDFTLQTAGNKSFTDIMASELEQMYQDTNSNLLKNAGSESFGVAEILAKANLKNYKPANNAEYPNSSLGKSLKQIAQLIKMDVGLEIAFTESVGWDTHFNQGTAIGTFSNSAADLSNSINAFWTDISSYQDDVTLITMTEFGRTVHQNGTGGTDHGRGSCMFVLGNDIIGGQVYGKVPELSIENLEDKRDLPVTIDIRNVLNEITLKHLNIPNNNVLFPEWKGTNIGITKA